MKYVCLCVSVWGEITVVIDHVMFMNSTPTKKYHKESSSCL